MLAGAAAVVIVRSRAVRGAGGEGRPAEGKGVERVWRNRERGQKEDRVGRPQRERGRGRKMKGERED